MSDPRGYVFYRGPSVLTDQPIVGVAIMHSNNEKTGDVVQTYMLVDDGQRPSQVLKSGDDSAVCGDCKHRPVNSGGCYVVVRQGATRVWLTLRNGQYPTLDPDRIKELFAGRTIRMGTYGDPVAIPSQFWKPILTASEKWIGYTHQWHMECAQWARYYCMASVDTPTEKAVANERGWRTFRVRLPNESVLNREAICPASEEAEFKLKCTDCGACNGALDGRRGNIVINVHGAKGPWQPVQRYTRWRAQNGDAA